MAQIKLVVGSVVRLKSGGPWMTVTKDKPEAGPKFLGVSWFNGTALEEKVLPKDAVEPDEATVKAAEAAEKAAAKAKSEATE